MWVVTPPSDPPEKNPDLAWPMVTVPPWAAATCAAVGIDPGGGGCKREKRRLFNLSQWIQDSQDVMLRTWAREISLANLNNRA